ncbi:hypothetical protein U9Z68_00005, partial [Escherichia coli]
MNNVLIVDDDILVADVIRRIVEQTPAFKCCGIALSLGQAKEIISVNKKLADLILLDLYINKDNGLDLLPGFAPIFPDTCYHLTHYWLAAVDIPVASDNPVHYADAIRYNAR